jgi:surface antigen
MRLIQPLRDLGPVMEQVAPMPYTILQTLQDAIFPHGLHVYWRSHFLPRLSDAVIGTIADAFANVSSPFTAVLIERLGGAVQRVGTDETAFAHREAEYSIAIIGRWVDPAGADEHIAWTRRFHEALAPHASGVYVNYLGEEGQDRIASAYSPKQYRRLVALKDAYDPTNFFRRNQNIRPSTPGGNGPTGGRPTPATATVQAASSAPVAGNDLRTALRADLDAARSLFLDTLALVGDDHWRDRSVGSRWRLGEVLAHMASYLDAVIPMALANARKGKNMPSMPAFLMNQMNYLLGKQAARGQNCRSLAARYEAAHARALALLGEIRNDEWHLETGLPIGRVIVEQIFRHHHAHCRLHGDEIRRTLAPAPAPSAARRA